jgi:hypothetical protein
MSNPNETKAAETKTSFCVVNHYGIGGEKGQVHYRPRATGDEAYTRCQKWVAKNDTAHTMRVEAYDL